MLDDWKIHTNETINMNLSDVTIDFDFVRTHARAPIYLPIQSQTFSTDSLLVLGNKDL